MPLLYHLGFLQLTVWTDNKKPTQWPVSLKNAKKDRNHLTSFFFKNVIGAFV